jgi:hypothetical protein
LIRIIERPINGRWTGGITCDEDALPELLFYDYGVAQDAGFGDLSNFNDAFRAEFGVSRTRFRNKRRLDKIKVQNEAEILCRTSQQPMLLTSTITPWTKFLVGTPDDTGATFVRPS